VSVLQTDEIQRALDVYGYSPASEYCEKVRTYTELLLRWNRKVALTTVSEPQEILRFHFGEALFGMGVAGMGDVENCRLADLGSGAGFPGVPIAMARTEISVTLVESNGKKAAFLAEICRELQLNNVKVHKGRAEDMAASEQFDFVTVRALGSHKKWLKWSSERVPEQGKIALWLGEKGIREVSALPNWRWADPAKIPRTTNRFVLVGSKKQADLPRISPHCFT
jgi:16S rRNA (guanine527-N7)-methyltransferase